MTGWVLLVSFVSTEVYDLYIDIDSRKKKFIAAMIKDRFERILYESM